MCAHAQQSPFQVCLRQALERVEVEGGVQEALQFGQVVLFVASRWGSSRFTPGIPTAREGGEQKTERLVGTGGFSEPSLVPSHKPEMDLHRGHKEEIKFRPGPFFSALDAESPKDAPPQRKLHSLLPAIYHLVQFQTA